jgi:hypothetical protein
MAVRLLTGLFVKIDGSVFEDFEVLPAGAITVIPGIVGTSGCALLDGAFLPRQ